MSSKGYWVERCKELEKALEKIANYDVEKETGYNDTLEKANSFSKLKRIAKEALDTLP